MEADVVELYSNFVKPRLPFTFLIGIILVSFPLAVFAGYRYGCFERLRLGYDKLPTDQLPGATSLGAMLALLGLLLGFAFNSSINWREARQDELVNEANALSTAFLTASLLAEPERTELQKRLLNYGQTRIATSSDIETEEAWQAFIERTMRAKAAIWPVANQALQGDNSDPVRVAVLASLTNLFDAHNRRIAAAAQQIPIPAKMTISLAAILALAVVGNRTALHGRPLTWRTFALALLLFVVTTVIFDLDRSLEGLMKSNPDTLLAEIEEMKKALLIEGK